MNANLKKGLSLIAFGFLFTLVNLNLNFGSGSLNIMPDFVGWILFTMAFSSLGTYVSGKKYLIYLSITMIILTGALWVLDLVGPEMDLWILQTVANVISTIYIFLLFGVLVRIAADVESTRTDVLTFLKYFNLVIGIILFVISLFALRIPLETLSMIVLVVGVIALVTAIVTMVTLFKLRKEVQ